MPKVKQVKSHATGASSSLAS